ncbi:3-oxo-5-beta-steroid 4-dehydrogenase [Tupaia chinensis]|uniref:3-oxo-5-beta-steroid 4-dehydrogenase n=1 Tax=Tupaia chinensis TaxID=246437 RepID=L9L5V8_TUPCH|nr:3-oxo-5-beta-steroid 4-dehydrogenase [Tupaia chinensis]
MYLSAANHRIPLSDGNSIPIIGLGTYSEPASTPKGACAASVKAAIDIGYRHIDGAYIYRNEHEIGEALREKIAEGKVRREDIFYCGKLWATNHEPERVRPTLEKTLKALNLNYVDLYIIEIPMAFKKPEEQYKVMLQVNGKELSKLSQEQTLDALRSSKEPRVFQEADRKDEVEYEEVELYKSSHGDKLGLMVCYGTDDEEALGRYRELLEIKCYLENGNQLGLLVPQASGGNGALDVNRNESLGQEMAMLEEELRHLEFKCRNILRAQKMRQLRERCMKAWLLEEESLYDMAACEPQKH